MTKIFKCKKIHIIRLTNFAVFAQPHIRVTITRHIGHRPIRRLHPVSFNIAILVMRGIGRDVDIVVLIFKELHYWVAWAAPFTVVQEVVAAFDPVCD